MGEGSSQTFFVPYKKPYDFQQLASFLGARAIAGVEESSATHYARSLRLGTASNALTGWLKIQEEPDNSALKVTLSDTLLPKKAEILERVANVFDTEADPEIIGAALSPLRKLHPGLPIPSVRVAGAFDPFEMAVRAVLGQQVTVSFAGTLADRITAAYGEEVETGYPGLTRIFPSPEVVARLSGSIEDDFGRLGVLSTRSQAIASLAQGLLDGRLDMSLGADPKKLKEQLLNIRGIGPWTAGYITMRSLGDPDVLLETDAAVKKVLRPLTPAQIRKASQQWSPWRSYATFNLWQVPKMQAMNEDESGRPK